MATTPTLLVKYAQAGDGYLTWRWVDNDGPHDFAGVARIAAADLAVVADALADAVPDPLSGESIADGVQRALLRGPLAHPESTARLTRQLGDILLPDELLATLCDAPTRPLVRIQPSASLTRVPWEMLLLDDLADIVGSAPATVRGSHRDDSGAIAPSAGPPEGPVVVVVDPVVPGQSATSPLGSVLGRPSNGSPLAALLSGSAAVRPAVAEYRDLARRTDVDRDWLRHHLDGAARLLYVGHVTAASVDGESVDAALHLCCTGPSGAALPLRAADLLSGGYHFPPRTALIGCNSGGDLRHPDAMGLSMAALTIGAKLVTATRWAVPTNRALAVAGELGNRQPLEELILAVDEAHRSTDPIPTLGRWQRERRARWYAEGHVADSPLLWAALTTTVG
ncbi:MAG TPA: CHAT domain-containing protein [Gordonia sp. (in: high G+C Gram-positive bacteria)]|uniref:CHAT domain-containing protein n=1 Tax=unclassified Gordonia (in: high G+C Gram-positive bacteria) TaxID=2657482 RepID=UPI000F9305C5|nr:MULTISPECIES: CHAT domain-containing protein [unclassified Gordonia (in: high G+C Gram-positive bacteria)]RUP36772.1 MAG: CHAT domain-containing protein [Gordonia sp. (in: high G+C Gram-positive bacteria)]HNP56965.1 CHAT domain-containing protein [Gordonia sp. (in: high G+C Gram-positive bacteria)]HRC50409.1 CHAT domain-containing protein [Gordonia sp. (in: high G+C Gram-positive bacteria)]